MTHEPMMWFNMWCGSKFLEQQVEQSRGKSASGLTLLHLSKAICGNAVVLAAVCLELFSFQCCCPLFALLPSPLSLFPVSTLTLCLVPLSLLLNLQADSVSMQYHVCFTKADCFHLCAAYCTPLQVAEDVNLKLMSDSIRTRAEPQRFD